MSLLKTDLELTKNSYYAATAPRRQRFPALEANIDADVAIVGGGLAGLSAAIELADRGYRVVVLEARQVGWGASGRNGGQAIAGGLRPLGGRVAARPRRCPPRLGHDHGSASPDRPAARAIRHRLRLAQRLPGPGRERAQGPRAACWHDQMQRDYGYETRWISPQEMQHWIASPRFHSGIHDPKSGHLHPLKYSLGLAAAAASLGVKIHEDSAVTAIQPGRVARLRTAQGSVSASHVLLAGNVYLQGIAPVLEARVMPVGTYIVTSEPIDAKLIESLIPSGSAVCDTNFVLDYFRPTVDHRMLYGGRVSYSTATPMNPAASMQRRMARSFPQLKNTKVEYAWGGFVDISMNRAPDFGRLSERLSGPERSDWANVYYLQGFSGHGLALTGLAGKLVAEAIAGDAERFDTFARIRHRPFPGGKLLRTPALVAGMAYYRLRDLL
ncbi:FAD-binding oxidoreductase [Piscinibacter aquaticus]|uniref:FAD-binding oxidoreductase n=1 Tax=Piscinibacter aquaticus TaxID=392597 RepID=A0A5C6U2R8_9BURK|nr:FAD-binding oxidoreductase [Piscinibacter aquaticus]